MKRLSAALGGLVLVFSTLAGVEGCSTDAGAGPDCTNGTRDGDEIGVDCGGSCGTGCTGATCTTDAECASAKCNAGSCAAKAGKPCGVGVGGQCADGQSCELDADCTSGLCQDAKCSVPKSPDGTPIPPGPNDGKKNNGETDVDCGGPSCGACAIGQMCAAGTDCVSGWCGAGGTCLPRVVISELRSFGPGGASDDYVEIYNPMSVPVVLDNQWTIEVRSTGAMSYATRWTGSGATLPPNSHYLIGGSGYVQMPTKDANLSSGITDASSVRLVYGAEILDILCYHTDATTEGILQGAGYTCEGPSKLNLTGAANNTKSMERLPGGMLGNGTDTNDNAADFMTADPANPQNLASPPTP